jgi:hypothetical protein
MALTSDDPHREVASETPAEEANSKPSNRDQRRRERNLLLAFWATLAAGALALLAFSLSADTSHVAAGKQFSLGLLVGGASALVGALLGFLFGLPRTPDEAPPTNHSLPADGSVGNQSGKAATDPSASTTTRKPGRANNNLLEISDWLTKIIVGAGLVGLKDLVRWLTGVSQVVGEGAGLTGSEAGVFGGAVIMFFFVWGFLFLYIQTRTIISIIFVTTERTLEDVLRDAVAGQVQQAVEDQVREQVVPELARASVGTIMQLLYSAPREAEREARTFLQEDRNKQNGLVWLYLACAYGQQHESAPAAKRSGLRDAALDALSRALTIDSGLRPIARGLMYEDDVNHLDGDSDLASFGDDPAFQELLGPPPKKST